MLSGLNPTEGRELKADEAICRAVLLLSSLPEAVPHVFILVKQETYVSKFTRSIHIANHHYSQYVERNQIQLTANVLHLFEQRKEEQFFL